MLRRDNAIPTYASACSGAVRYSSACSCIGVTAAGSATTVTIGGSTLTSTTTTTVVSNIKTVSATTTTTQTSSFFSTTTVLPTFRLQAEGTANQGLDGKYASLNGGIDDEGAYGVIIFNIANLSGGYKFSLDADGHLIYNGTSIADHDTGGQDEPVFIDPIVDVPEQYYPRLICSISTGYLLCSCQNSTVFLSEITTDSIGRPAGKLNLFRESQNNQYYHPINVKVILV
jgi:hypothetical protein